MDRVTTVLSAPTRPSQGLRTSSDGEGCGAALRPGLGRPRFVALLVVSVLAVAACSTAPPPGATQPNVTQPNVTHRQLDLRDDSRQTDPTPDVPGDESDGRDLPTTLFLPATPGPHPLIVFSHGLGGGPRDYDALLDGWADAGFAVAALTFPLTSAGSAEVIADIAAQPADISFVIESVLELAATGGELDGIIDPDEVAVAGHSAGAISTIGVLTAPGGHPHVSAAVVLAGSTAIVGSDFVPPPVPTLFVHGEDDDVIPYSEGTTAYAASPEPKAGIVLLGGTHVTPYRDPGDPAFSVVLETSVDFFDWALQRDDQALATLRKDASQSGIAELIADDLPV